MTVVTPCPVCGIPAWSANGYCSNHEQKNEMSVIPREERAKVKKAIDLLIGAYSRLPSYGLNVDPRKARSLDRIIERLEAWLK